MGTGCWRNNFWDHLSGQHKQQLVSCCLRIPLTNHCQRLPAQTIPEVAAPKACTHSPAVSGVARMLKRLTNQHFYNKKPTFRNMTYLKQHFGEEETCLDESTWLILMNKKKRENTKKIHFGFSKSLHYQQTKTFCNIGRFFIYSRFLVLAVILFMRSFLRFKFKL